MGVVLMRFDHCGGGAAPWQPAPWRPAPLAARLQAQALERDPSQQYRSWVGFDVRIGDGEVYLPYGEHTYVIRYKTTRQLGFFDGHDELYWNAIGTGWAFPIESGSAEVRLPQPVPVAELAAEGYTGAQGTRGQGYVAETPEPGLARWRLTAPLAPGEGLTIVLSFPKGLVPEPTTAQK